VQRRVIEAFEDRQLDEAALDLGAPDRSRRSAPHATPLRSQAAPRSHYVEVRAGEDAGKRA